MTATHPSMARPARPATLRTALAARPWPFALLLVIALFAANAMLQDSFLTWDRWVDISATIAPFVLVAFGSTPQILGGRGGIDISVGPLAILVNCIFVSVLIPNGLGDVWISLPILVVVGAAAGLANGLLVTVGRLQPVIATLATFFVFSGLALRLSPTPEFAGQNWTSRLTGSFGPLPGGLVLILVAVATWLVLGAIGFSRQLYLVGSDDVAAFSAGLNVIGVRLGAYAIGGGFAALAGVALTAVVQTSQPALAPTYSLIALAAVSLGGTSLAGGRGGLLGSLLGAVAIFLLQELLAAGDVPISYVQFMYGLLLVAGVVLSGVSARRGVP